jgi:uncharacterized membrane protein YgcG
MDSTLLTITQSLLPPLKPVPLAGTAKRCSTWIAMVFAMCESSQKIVGCDSRSRGSVECDSTQKTIGCAGGGGRSAGSERVSGWEAIGLG